MKRLALFVVALVFAFCTTVMAVETSPDKVKKEEAAGAQVNAPTTPAPKVPPAKVKKADPKKDAKRAEKIKKEEAAEKTGKCSDNAGTESTARKSEKG